MGRKNVKILLVLHNKIRGSEGIAGSITGTGIPGASGRKQIIVESELGLEPGNHKIS